MNEEEKLKQLVKDKYTEIAEQDIEENKSSCCGAGGCSTEVYNIMTDDYGEIKGYEENADLGLGCGLPTQFAQIERGDVVIDLGSGAGNDCFVARHEAGPAGKVIGIDFTEAMISKARENAEKLGYHNVEFRYGDIDNMPVSENYADVVVSNCVLNLVPNKQKVFTEIMRVLNPGGHFSISDIVLVGDLPDALKSDAEMYAGCVAGAIQMDEYLGMIQKSGFENIEVQKKKAIDIPNDILERYLAADEIQEFNSGATGIYSITVFAAKPGKKKVKLTTLGEQTTKAECCGPDSNCC